MLHLPEILTQSGSPHCLLKNQNVRVGYVYIALKMICPRIVTTKTLRKIESVLTLLQVIAELSKVIFLVIQKQVTNVQFSGKF